jgi:hypothetical protein
MSMSRDLPSQHDVDTPEGLELQYPFTCRVLRVSYIRTKFSDNANSS